MIRTGYGDEAAYSKLIFACNSTEKNKLFEFNPQVGVWAEDNCPWDYDHILPHSWVDKLSKSDREKYAWLINSVGNLAPIDFSINRQLSDSERNEFYPFKESSDGVKDVQRKCLVHVEGEQGRLDVSGMIKDMANFRKDEVSAVLAFYKSTLLRFVYIYNLWYSQNGFEGLFCGQKLLTIRKSIIEGLSKRIKDEGIVTTSILLCNKENAIEVVDSIEDISDCEWHIKWWIGIRLTKKDACRECWIDRRLEVKVGDRKDDEYIQLDDLKGVKNGSNEEMNMIMELIKG